MYYGKFIFVCDATISYTPFAFDSIACECVTFFESPAENCNIKLYIFDMCKHPIDTDTRYTHTHTPAIHFGIIFWAINTFTPNKYSTSNIIHRTIKSNRTINHQITDIMRAFDSLDLIRFDFVFGFLLTTINNNNNNKRTCQKGMN